VKWQDNQRLADALHLLGYRPEDDSWDTDGRITYSHDEDATKGALKIVVGALARLGWQKHETRLRTLRHWKSGDIIELEPGGADCTGHYLHYMKASVLA
jgi:hypothetical protein